MKIVKSAGEWLLPRWLAAELRPLLAVHGAGRALATGSAILGRRAWSALTEHLHGWERAGALAFTGYALVYGCAQAPDVARFAIPGAVLAWCAAAWFVAPPATDEADPETATVQPPSSDPQDVYGATLDWVRRQIGDRQGVHLRDLLAHARAHGMFEGLEVSDLRGHLERHRIPVRSRVRVRGLGVTVGVHRDDLPPLPEPSPESGVQDPPDSELHPV